MNTACISAEPGIESKDGPMRPVVRHWGLPASPIDFTAFRRLVIWFSCGAASAVAAKLALDQARDSGIETVVAYIDTGSEHEDNVRFLADVSAWLGHEITTVRNEKYRDIWDVFEKNRYVAGVAGAKCTSVLKKHVREEFERDGDLQVFGYDATEQDRVDRFARDQPEVALWCPLVDRGIPKARCFTILSGAMIALPVMYLLGFLNNNCIGCVKGGNAYWNLIRVHFPMVFARMCELTRRLNVRLVKITANGERIRIFLDELPPDADDEGDAPSMSCGIVCNQPDMFDLV